MTMNLNIPENRKVVDEEKEIYIEDQAWIEQATKALGLLQITDHYINKSVERARSLSPAFIAWREQLRSVVNGSADAVESDTPPPAFDPIAPAADAVPLPPLDEKLADWGDLPSLTPDEADAEVARLMSNQAEGFDLADEISGLSQARRNDLTHALHRKKGRMRRERMTGAAPQVEEAAIDHLVDLLARRGV